MDFFQLLFTLEILQEISTHTNAYAWKKQHYGEKDGSWQETTPSEIHLLIALIIYCGLVKVGCFHRY